MVKTARAAGCAFVVTCACCRGRQPRCYWVHHTGYTQSSQQVNRQGRCQTVCWELPGAESRSLKIRLGVVSEKKENTCRHTETWLLIGVVTAREMQRASFNLPTPLTTDAL